MAIELDRRYSKNQILEWYLNQVPFGRNSYGVEAAAQTYFGKPVNEVNIGEAATLIAFIQMPSYFWEHQDELFKRKDYILDRMVETGYLSHEQAEEAKKIDIKFADSRINIKAPYFTLWVKQQLEQEYGAQYLQRGGLNVYTSLDWDLQMLAEKKWLMASKGIMLIMRITQPLPLSIRNPAKSLR